MRCLAPNCDNDSNHTSSHKISYFKFPTEKSLRAAWFEALLKTDWYPDQHSVVCSQHFLQEDLLQSSGGRRELRAGAVPVAGVLACRICFATECKLYSMTEYMNLCRTYETFTGFLVEIEHNLPPYLCTECARQLVNCASFRTRSLRAHLTLLEIVKEHDFVTLKSIQSIKKLQNLSNLTCNESDQSFDVERPEKECIAGEQADKRHLPGSSEDIADVTAPVIVKEEEAEIVINVVIPIDGLSPSDDGMQNNDVTMNLGTSQMEISNDDGVDKEAFAGEDFSSSNSGAVEEARQKAKPSTSGAPEMGKVPDANVCSQESQFDDGLKIHTEQSCDKFLCQTKSSHAESHADSESYDWKLEKPYLCDVCNKAFSRKTNLNRHLEMDHSGAKRFPCKVCVKTFSRASILQKHMRIHSNANKPFSCHICHKVFSVKNNLEEHLQAHSGVKPYSCEVCQKMFGYRSNLQVHMRVAHSVGKQLKQYSCEVCQKAFGYKSSLQTHMRSHSDVKPYSCHICNKAFSVKVSLESHLRVHSGKKPYSCGVCNKAFGDKSNLHAHKQIHSGMQPYSCKICNKAFSVKRNFLKHMRRHTGVKPYSCHVCNKAFSLKATLQTHLLIHAGVKPYSCNVCSKAFSKNSTLQTHLRVHSGVKPYSCSVCNKAFRHKCALTTHMRIHSGVKPYSCEVCNKSFSDKSNLQTHLQRH